MVSKEELRAVSGEPVVGDLGVAGGAAVEL